MRLQFTGRFGTLADNFITLLKNPYFASRSETFFVRYFERDDSDNDGDRDAIDVFSDGTFEDTDANITGFAFGGIVNLASAPLVTEDFRVADVPDNLVRFFDFTDGRRDVDATGFVAAVQSRRMEITGSDAADTIAATALFDLSRADTFDMGGGHDKVNAGAGADTIRGGTGRDTLGGGAGRDTLEGGEGRDLLKGGKGNDTLRGGEGFDILNGGGGADVFLFGWSAGNDRIVDFQDGTDRIGLANADWIDRIRITTDLDDLILRLGDNTLRLVDQAGTEITAADFVIA